MIARHGLTVGPMTWAEQGACRSLDPDLMFTQGAEQHRSKRVCDNCPVKLECLTEALDNRIEFGVWGGLTERQRRVILTKRPDVRSWRPILLGIVENASIRAAS